MKILTTILCCLGWSLGALAQGLPPDPEAQLRIIRQALIEAVMERTTKVNAMGWIDGKGQLQESAHFQTDAKIRGIRVQSYMMPEGHDAKIKVSMEDLPWSVRAALSGPGESCEPVAQNWRQSLSVTTTMHPSFPGPERYAATTLARHIQAQLMRLAQDSQRWNTEALPVSPTDAYQRAWLGQGENINGWYLEVHLTPIEQKATPSHVGAATSWLPSGHSRQWHLRARYGRKSAPDMPLNPEWERRLVLNLPAEVTSIQPERWIQTLIADLTPELSRWVVPQALRSSCDVVQFSVNPSKALGWSLQAGIGNGLKVGDRVLVLNANRIPARIFEPGSIQDLAIAEVIRVGRRQTELRPLAGTVNPGPGDWVALPL